MIVTFTAQDLKMIEKLAHGRNDPKIGVVRNRRIDQKRGDLQINFKGLLAEHAVATALGIKINKETGLYGDGGITDLVFRGKTVQVKYNFYRDGSLYFNFQSELKADIAVLVVPHSEKGLNIIGYITQDDFWKQCRPLDWGYGQRWGVPQSSLTNIMKLKEGADDSS